jgi:group I intron endonuclease
MIKNLVNSKRYIGKTTASPPTKRWRQHLKISKNIELYRRKGKAHYIHNAIHKYGLDNFEFSIIETLNDEESCNNSEKYWISFYASNISANGYNLTLGGDGTIPTLSTRAKMRAAALKDRKNKTSLDENKVLQIKKLLLECKMSQKQIASLFSIRPQTVGRIAKSQIFKDIISEVPLLIRPTGYNLRQGENNNQSKFSQQEAEIIRNEFTSGMRIKDLASKYNCSRQLIHRIIHKKSYVG